MNQNAPTRDEADMFLSCLQHRFPKRVSEVRLLIKTCSHAEFNRDELCAVRDTLVSADQLTAFYHEMEISREAGIAYLRTLMPEKQSKRQSGLSGVFVWLYAAFR